MVYSLLYAAQTQVRQAGSLELFRFIIIITARLRSRRRVQWRAPRDQVKNAPLRARPLGSRYNNIKLIVVFVGASIARVFNLHHGCDWKNLGFYAG